MLVENDFSKLNSSVYYLIKKESKQRIKNKKKKNIIFNVLSLILFITSYHFYYLSLEKCLNGEDVCSQKWEWIQLKLKQLIISIIIIISQMILINHNIISKLHLFHFITIFIFFYKYSHSYYFHDHGAFNLIGLFFVLFLYLLLLILIKIIIFVLKIKYNLLIVIALLISYNLFSIQLINCDDWAKGLNNTYIENDINKYGCQIKFPKKCYYKILGYTQDLSKLFHIDCNKKKKNSKENILKFSKSSYINENTKKFGFPLTNIKEGELDGKDDIILKHYTSENLLDMDKILQNESHKAEFIVDFSKDPFGELMIKLNYNETLSIERKKVEKNFIPYSENILIIYIDSVSRANSIRKLVKTLNFFEQFISYKGGFNKKFPHENFHSFQFFKYHSFRGVTVRNFPIIFYGNEDSNDYIRITKYLKENGYITCYSADLCQKDNTRTNHNLTKAELYDHQLVLCDPNIIDYNVLVKKCLYGNLNSYHLFNYSNQFWRKYHNNRKFLSVILNDGHEGTLEVIKYTDKII